MVELERIVYVFVTGINVNNGDFGGRAINRHSCLSLCAEVSSCTDNISYFSNFGSCVDAYTSRGEYSDEVVKEAEAAAVEGETVDFLEVDADRKDEATLRDFVAEEVLVPAVGAPQTGWRVDRFPRGPGPSSG